MPTARSWTDPVRDVGHLLAFRSAAVRRRGTLQRVSGVMIGLTLLAMVLPAYLPGAADGQNALQFAILLPSGMAGFLGLAILSAVASGGGRELIARDQAVAFPVSPATDHLGALVLAPLNIAWLLQAWTLFVASGFGLGPEGLGTMLPLLVVWLAIATAVGQAVAWSLEAVRRRRHGIVAIRCLGVAVAGAALWLQLTGQVTAVLDRLPTVRLVVEANDGFSWSWVATLVLLVAVLLAVVLVGVLPARVAARRAPVDEARAESEVRRAAPLARTDLRALLRMDRATVWRSVPMRRGLAVLALGPGLVALAGDLPWSTLVVLPGLVASGGALLFGVNAWCLDGRGQLWRENLPVDPGQVFAARTIVTGEFLAAAAVVTLLLAALRADAPTAGEVAALLCALVVVVVQVVAAAMRWSDQRPFAVDLRSARATPAPPVVMVGYSSRLALSTTMTGLVFSALSRSADWQPVVLVAVPFVAWSTWRLLRTRRRWLDPVTRARVVMAVAA